MHCGVLLELEPPGASTVPLLHQQQLGPGALPAIICFISDLERTFLTPFRLNLCFFILIELRLDNGVQLSRTTGMIFKSHAASLSRKVSFAYSSIYFRSGNWYTEGSICPLSSSVGVPF